MARPTTKEMLLSQSEENRQKLIALIASIPADKQEGEFPFEDRDRNIRDVLIHLYEWHQMMINWYTIGMDGGKPDIPAKGYTWQTIPALNLAIWERYQSTPLDKAKTDLEESHKTIMAMIERHTDEELFTKKYYKWTNTTSLGAYFISSASSHYDWAIKKIKKYVKELKAEERKN